jgi:hypothetical protein
VRDQWRGEGFGQGTCSWNPAKQIDERQVVVVIRISAIAVVESVAATVIIVVGSWFHILDCDITNE